MTTYSVRSLVKAADIVAVLGNLGKGPAGCGKEHAEGMACG